MTELTDQQKLERRRLKRQQRILQSAGDRLERITGTAFPDRVSPSPSPSNSATSLRPVSSCSSNRMTNSHRPLRAVSSVPSLQQKQQDFSMDNINNTNSMDVAEHFPASNDLRRRTYDTYSKPIMEDIKSAENIPSILTESPLDETTPSFLSPINQKQPISLLNTLLMRKLYRQRHHHSLDPSLKYWNALHFASMIWLTFCGLYTEWQEIGNLDRFAGLLLDQGQSITQFPLFRNFIMLELLLLAAFSLYHPENQYPSIQDDFTLVATQLPSPFDQIMTSVLGYRRTLFCLIQDLSIIVFIIGFTQVLAYIF